MDVSRRIAFDSNVISYFLQASRDGYDPARDPDPLLARQRVAAYRLFLHCDDIVVLPTVADEVEQIPNVSRRREHTTWTHYHWHEVLSRSLSEEALTTRAAELSAWHSGESNANDCRITAECEESGTPVFATFDNDLILHLRFHVGVFVASPDECWQRLGVTPGSEPRWTPDTGNPLFNAT